MDPEAIRRRGMRKVAIGVAVLVAIIVATFLLAPLYYR